MKIITINVNKGGAGKTTLAYNFAEYLSQKHRILLMDLDDSANLTNRYGNFVGQSENTVISLFDTGKVTPLPLHHNLDMIAGSREVELLKERLMSRRRREEILGKWLAENYEMLSQTYDYLIIDTENDEGILTQNALIVSDLVIGVAEAGKDSYLALLSLREFVNDLNHDFENKTQMAVIANKINLSENASKDLIEELEDWDEYLGYMPRRTLLAAPESLFQEASKIDATVQHISLLFDALQRKIDNVED